MVNVPCQTKAVKVEFEYGGTDIIYVNIEDLFVSKAASSIRSSTPQSIEIDVDDWVFPKGGVVFVWVLESEMSEEFLKIQSQRLS